MAKWLKVETTDGRYRVDVTRSTVRQVDGRLELVGHIVTGNRGAARYVQWVSIPVEQLV